MIPGKTRFKGNHLVSILAIETKDVSSIKIFDLSFLFQKLKKGTLFTDSLLSVSPKFSSSHGSMSNAKRLLDKLTNQISVELQPSLPSVIEKWERNPIVVHLLTKNIVTNLEILSHHGTLVHKSRGIKSLQQTTG